MRSWCGLVRPYAVQARWGYGEPRSRGRHVYSGVASVLHRLYRGGGDPKRGMQDPRRVVLGMQAYALLRAFGKVPS